MLNVKHIHFSHHTDESLRRYVDVKTLHEGQNDIWVLGNEDTFSVILVAHETKVIPTAEIQIDTFEFTYDHTTDMAYPENLDELIREFLGDKRNKIIYAPKNLVNVAIIAALERANFLYDDKYECYVKVPQNR